MRPLMPPSQVWIKVRYNIKACKILNITPFLCFPFTAMLPPKYCLPTWLTPNFLKTPFTLPLVWIQCLAAPFPWKHLPKPTVPLYCQMQWSLLWNHLAQPLTCFWHIWPWRFIETEVSLSFSDLALLHLHFISSLLLTLQLHLSMQESHRV